MVWIYDSPFTKREEAAYAVLKKRFKKYDLAKETVKILSLTTFLRSQNFKTVSEIQQSAFFDREQTKPIFNEKTAKLVLKGLKKKGGAESEYDFTKFTVDEYGSWFISYLPDFIQYPLRNIYKLLTSPLPTIKENVPLAGLALDVLHGATETGVTTTADAAEAVGGPFGAAIVTPFIAVAGTIASIVAILEQDTGQAVAHLLNIIPLFGSALTKLQIKIEHIVKSLGKHQDIVPFIPVVNDYYASKTPQVAGKRFSTQRHKHTKWPKTRRNKSAKI